MNLGSVIVNMPISALALAGCDLPGTATLTGAKQTLELRTDCTEIVLTRYREELVSGSEKRKALTATIVSVGLACFITSITTMAGFGSLYSSSLTLIKDFGLSTAIGVGFAFIVTVTFFLAFLFTAGYLS